MKAAQHILKRNYQQAVEHLASLDDVESELLAVVSLPRCAFFEPITRKNGARFIPEVQQILEHYEPVLTRLGYGSLVVNQIKIAQMLLRHI